MDVIQMNDDGSFKLIDEVKESVRLGDGLNDSEMISDDKMRHAIDTLQFFTELAQALSVDHMICTATEAVRRASNRSVFLDAAKKQLGLEIRLLTGTEEAYYDYIGAVNSMNLPDCLIMDIGGNSTEIIKVIDNDIVHSVSLPIGSIMISQMFHLEKSFDDQVMAKMHNFIKEQFREIDWIYGVDTLIGIGGSFRNLAKVHQKKVNYPLDLIHNYEMKPVSAAEIYSTFKGLSEEERKKVKGLSKDRADIFSGALAEILVLLDMTGISDLIISGSGLRDGLFYDWLLGEKIAGNKDVFSFSIQNAMNNYGLNQNHAKQVWSIAQQLYHQLQKELGINSTRMKILKAAALLHDSGININYFDHHKHAFYMILNSRLYGLTHKELVMTAWTASIHRKSVMKVPGPFHSFLSNDEILTVQQLGVLLQIAESLDRRQNANIYRIQSTVHPEFIKIIITAKTNPCLELRDVQNARQNFKKVFKKQLIIESSTLEACTFRT